MMLSKRERMLAIVTGAVVGLLLVYWIVDKSILQPLNRVENQKLQLDAELQEAKSLIERKQQWERKWKPILSDGLRSDTEAESRIARALDEWSADARLTLTSVQPQPQRMASSDEGLKEITFVVAGKGTVNAVAWFLYQIETAELPVKVKNITLSSSSESGDSMSLTLALSALYLGAEQKSSDTQSQPKQREANDEEQLLL